MEPQSTHTTNQVFVAVWVNLSIDTSYRIAVPITQKDGRVPGALGRQ
jgi:hypothetical protein